MIFRWAYQKSMKLCAELPFQKAIAIQAAPLIVLNGTFIELTDF